MWIKVEDQVYKMSLTWTRAFKINDLALVSQKQYEELMKPTLAQKIAAECGRRTVR